MKTKPSASIILVAIIASVIVLAPIVKQAIVTIYQWLVPIVKAQVKAQAGTEVIKAAHTCVEVSQQAILKVDSTLLMIAETAKQVYTHSFYLPTATEMYQYLKTQYMLQAHLLMSPLFTRVLKYLV